jgi:glyoxylase-like metal-dependent hydrolase (beta-lactamase superfamily II)
MDAAAVSRSRETVTAEGVAEAESRALRHPFERPPGPGEAVQVTEGVLWLRLPLPFSLDHINVWALNDEDGWTIVDSGLATPQARELWPALLAGPLGGWPVRRVICTHMHPDHVGMAGWLVERFACPLWMTRLEYTTCRMLIADAGQPAPEQGVQFYRSAGWSEAQLDGYRQGFGRFGRAVHAFPSSFTRMSEGDLIRIGGRDWRVVVGSGHCPEHACLYRGDDQLLISGDQVLPHISSNVSVHPTEPDANPLGDWLSSIDKLLRQLPAETLVLPSHGEPFTGLHHRLARLKERHEHALERVLGALDQPRRVVDVFPAIFRRPIGEADLGLATGEALSHLNWLLAESAATRELDGEGILWWRRASA